MRLRLIAQAFLFTLIVTGPELFELFRFHALSPKTFSDWDEPYYFPIAMSHGRALLDWIQGHSTFTGNYLSYLFFIAPQEVLSSVVGLVAVALHLRSTTLGAILDIGACFTSYIVFSLFYRALGPSNSRAAAATLVTLFFPWLLYLPQFAHLPISLGPDVASVPHSLYPCQPVVRGLGTQLSYPLFGLALLFGITGTKGNRKALLFSGLLSGLLVYLYFFSWPATIALLCIFIACAPKPVKERISDIVVYLAAAVIASLPALYMLHYNFAPRVAEAVSGATPTHQINDALWYFSPEQFLLLVVLSIWLFRNRDNSVLRLCVSALVAEFLLMNSQKILGIHTAPYHFPLIYLNPILSGALFVSLLGCFRNINLKSYPTMLLGAAMVFMQGGQLRNFLIVTGETREFTTLVETIEREVPHNGIIMFPPSDFDSKSGKDQYHYFTIPYWVNALTERPLFSNYVGATPDGSMGANLLNGWIYFGSIEPFVPCPKVLPKLPGDILSGMMTREYWARYYACAAIPEYIASHPLCKLLQDNPFAFVVWQHSVTKVIPPTSARYIQSLWKSSTGEYELFRFNQELAKVEACLTSVSAPSSAPPQDNTSTPVP